jgi:nitroreductase
MDVQVSARSRRSVRAFLAKPIDPVVLRELFTVAQHAPSWCNIQPWRVWVTSGATTRALTDALVAAAQASRVGNPEWPWPVDYPEPYRAERIACAVALYGALGIRRDDHARRDEAWLDNYRAFGAPHVAVVALDSAFSVYGALDIGCWLQTLMLAACERGVATCAQASLAYYPDAVRSVLPIPARERVLVGVALGYEDTNAEANRCKTTRAPLQSNVTFV